METNAVNPSLVWDCDPLRTEVKQCESTLREHPESQVVSDYSVASEEDELTLSGFWVAERRRTCEDVLAQSRRAAIFAVVEVLRGGGALEVLNGQAVAQDIWLQVRTRAELPTTNTNTHEVCTRKRSLVLSELHMVCEDCATSGENKASVL